jgi:hypothetical protein
MGKLTATKKAISEAVDKALDMSQAARMERAREMGYDTDTVWKHGTNKPIRQFKKPRANSGYNELGPGTYLTREDAVSNIYASGNGGNVIPVHVKGGDYFDYSRFVSEPKSAALEIAHKMRENRELAPDNLRISGWLDASPEDHADFMRRAIQNDMDGTAKQSFLQWAGYKGAYDPTSQVPDQLVVFNPQDIRSVNARFDPAKSDSPNLLAGGAAAAVGLGAATQGEEASAMDSPLSIAGQDFLQRRQEKRGQWDALRQDLIGAMDQAIQAIEMPWRGYLGLSRMAGGLVAGEGFDQALAQGAQQARQPVEQTAYDLGGQVTDATGSPGLGTAVNLGVNLGGPI